jgi:DNA-binding transcriptional ArsR family regulator
MQPRQEHNVQLPSNDASRPLPMQLAQSLEPKTKHALMHGMRRRILRALSEDPTPRTSKDLLTTFPGVSLSTVSYHVLVLTDYGSLAVSHVEQVHGTVVRSFVSNVADNAQYIAVLRATEQLDDVEENGPGQVEAPFDGGSTLNR